MHFQYRKDDSGSRIAGIAEEHEARSGDSCIYLVGSPK